MHVSELVTIGVFFRDLIQGQNFVGLYQDLIKAVGEAVSVGSADNVTLKLKHLQLAHETVQCKIWNPSESLLIERYGVSKIIGKSALDRLESIFNENQMHPQRIVVALQKILQETNQLQKRTEQLVHVLKPMFDNHEKKVEELSAGGGRLRLFFEDTSACTLEDLEKAVGNWRQIICAFSQIPGAIVEDKKLVHVEMQPVLELEIVAHTTILSPLMFGIRGILEQLEQIAKIGELTEVLQQMKIGNKIVDALYEAAKEKRLAIVDEVANRFKVKYKLENEIHKAVRNGLVQVYEFLEKGGKLDINLNTSSNPQVESGEDGAYELKRNIEYIAQKLTLVSIKRKASKNSRPDTKT